MNRPGFFSAWIGLLSLAAFPLWAQPGGQSPASHAVEVPDPPQKNEVPGYYGPIGCQGLMDPAALAMARQRIRAAGYPQQQKEAGRDILRQHCLSTSQRVDLLSAFDFETDRLEMAKEGYASLYDLHYAYRLILLFGHESNALELLAWLSTRNDAGKWVWARPLPGAPAPAQASCQSPLLTEELDDVLKYAQAVSFQETRQALVRYLAHTRCLRSAQVVRILQLFAFEDQRLEATQYLYPYTYDPQNYATVGQALGLQESKDRLEHFLAQPDSGTK